MVGMEAFYDKLGLLTRKEKEWLLGNIKLPKAYEYRLRSGIRKKLRILIEFELPLLSVHLGVSATSYHGDSY
jgi:hypothetical protein